MSQDHLEANQGDMGAVGLDVEHHDGGVREQVHGLPDKLETSPLSKPAHGAKPSRPGQKPHSSPRPGTGR
jgi:hypothetical protein